MALRGILYKKLRQKIAEHKAKKEIGRRHEALRARHESRIERPKLAGPVPRRTVIAAPVAEIKGSARYWGGHFLYPIKTIEIGEITVNKHAIIFTKYGLLRRMEWNIEIPLNKVEWSKISHATEDDGLYNITCFTIPFKDENGVRHNPKFSIESSRVREIFSKFLYKKMTK